MKWICSNTHAAVVHNKIQYQTVFTFTCCAWRTTLDNRNTSFFKIACKCNLSALGFCQLLHFGFIAPSCQKHEKWTNVLLGLSTSVSEWSMPPTADYITLSVHLCLTGGAPPPAMKRQSTGTIWSDSLVRGRQPSQSNDSWLQSTMLQSGSTNIK